MDKKKEKEIEDAKKDLSDQLRAFKGVEMIKHGIVKFSSDMPAKVTVSDFGTNVLIAEGHEIKSGFALAGKLDSGAELMANYEVGLDWNDDVRANYLVKVIRSGIDYKNFNKIQETLPFEIGDWTKILGLTKRTLERYKEEGKTFKPQQSERIVEVSQLYNKGVDVFGDAEKFTNWMHSKNMALGNVPPITLLDTSIGINMITDELTRIEYGVFV